MRTKIWQINEHTVQVNHNPWDGERTVLVDNRVVFSKKMHIDLGSIDEVYVGNQSVWVCICHFPEYIDLVIDGVSQLTGKPVYIQQHTPLWAWGFLALNTVMVVMLPIEGKSVNIIVKAIIFAVLMTLISTISKNIRLLESKRVGLYTLITVIMCIIPLVSRG